MLMAARTAGLREKLRTRIRCPPMGRLGMGLTLRSCSRRRGSVRRIPAPTDPPGSGVSPRFVVAYAPLDFRDTLTRLPRGRPILLAHTGEVGLDDVDAASWALRDPETQCQDLHRPMGHGRRTQGGDQSPAKNRGYYSDNRLSRVSAHHVTGGPTGGCTRQ